MNCAWIHSAGFRHIAELHVGRLLWRDEEYQKDSSRCISFVPFLLSLKKTKLDLTYRDNCDSSSNTVILCGEKIKTLLPADFSQASHIKEFFFFYGK